VWDFDWAWKDMQGVCTYFEGYAGGGWAHKINDCFTDNYSTGWYVRLLQDSTFANELRCTYEAYRQTMLSTNELFAYIDSMGTRVQNAQARHFQKWPLLGRSGPAPDFGVLASIYPGELDSLKSWIGKRIQWLDANIPGLCVPAGVTEGGAALQVKCYPNPTQGGLTLAYTLPMDLDVTIHMYNSTGAEVYAAATRMQGAGGHAVQLDTGAFAAGIYLVKFEIGADVLLRKVVVGR
jgi:hypothetical protein